jgi:hypothetical protein
MSKAKLCPFCGSKAKVENIDDGLFMVVCSNDDCNMIIASSERTRVDAVKVWNSRVIEQSLLDFLKEFIVIGDRPYYGEFANLVNRAEKFIKELNQ